MGLQFYTLDDLEKILEKSGLTKAVLYTLKPFLPASQQARGGDVVFILAGETPYWKFLLPTFEFEQWFRFNQASPVPTPPGTKQDWEIGFVTNAIYEIERVRYSSGGEAVFNPGKAVIDSESKESFPFFAKGQGQFGIASYVFEYSKSDAVVKEPQVVAKHIKDRLTIDRAPLLQLWLEDSPWSLIPDSNRDGGRLTQFQRILILKAWIAAKPVGGEVPSDGWFFESTSYCSSMIVDIPKESRSTFALQPTYKFDSYAFSAPDNFRPTSVDRSLFARANGKSQDVTFRRVDVKRLQQSKPITSGVTANERADQWARQVLWPAGGP